MKKLLLLVALLAFSTALMAQKKGYKVEINFKEPIPDEQIYLTRYFARPFPSLFKIDSVQVTGNKKKIVFESKDSILGGFYAIIFSNRTKVLDFILDNGYNMVIHTDTTGKRSNTTVKGNLDNEINIALGRISEKYEADLEKTKNDTLAFKKIQEKIAKDINEFRTNTVKKHPNLLVTKFYKTFEPVNVPKGPHYLEDGKTIDSFFEMEYTSAHYWDNFDLQDDRLIISPIYEKALETYFDYFVYPIPDTVKVRADKLLKKTEGTEELYKFTMRWLTQRMLKSKIMGMDEVFVYLVENYHLQGKTPWLDANGIKEYTDIAYKLSPTSLGALAPELQLQDIFSRQDVNLHQTNGAYTVVLFWDVECGNCRTEIAAMDTLYRTYLKEKGVKIYAIATNGQLDKIQNFIKENNGLEWYNVADFKNDATYKEKYNVLGTPAMFLLDKNKKVIGKKINHENLKDIIEWHQKKEAKKP